MSTLHCTPRTAASTCVCVPSPPSARCGEAATLGVSLALCIIYSATLSDVGPCAGKMIEEFSSIGLEFKTFSITGA
ncbi:hypothetical protein M8J77_001443 [Diaphorina citri]|nr:hypothetical protein M8J77_001443 [Diaphorina citri]